VNPMSEENDAGNCPACKKKGRSVDPGSGLRCLNKDCSVMRFQPTVDDPEYFKEKTTGDDNQ